jgi:hypothetical protein
LVDQALLPIENVNKSIGSCFDPSITLSNGTLVFDNYELFVSTYECLQDRVRAHVLDFAISNNTLSYDQLDSVAYATSFNDFDPLLSFESTFAGFNSLRKELQPKLVLWESTDDLVDSLDPTNGYTGDEILWTLLDKKGNVIISDSIVNFKSNQSKIACILGTINPKIVKTWPSNSNKRVITRFDFFATPSSMFLPDYVIRGCSIKNQRKNSNGNWVLSFTNLLASFKTQPWNTNCTAHAPLLMNVDSDNNSRIMTATKGSLHYVGPSNFDFFFHNRNIHFNVFENGDTFCFGPVTGPVNNPFSYDLSHSVIVEW